MSVIIWHGGACALEPGECSLEMLQRLGLPHLQAGQGLLPSPARLSWPGGQAGSSPLWPPSFPQATSYSARGATLTLQAPPLFPTLLWLGDGDDMPPATGRVSLMLSEEGRGHVLNGGIKVRSGRWKAASQPHPYITLTPCPSTPPAPDLSWGRLISAHNSTQTHHGGDAWQRFQPAVPKSGRIWRTGRIPRLWKRESTHIAPLLLEAVKIYLKTLQHTKRI